VRTARRARLAKADLLTDMVGEFPELQGIMGGYYARHDGLGDGRGASPSKTTTSRVLPATPCHATHTGTCVVALADKLETLVGLFGIGQLPTGDKDPFALRRHALGVIRILVEKQPAAGPGRAGRCRAQAAFAGQRTSQGTAGAAGSFFYDRLVVACCASRATAPRRSMPCVAAGPPRAWAMCPSAWPPCAPSRPCPRPWRWRRPTSASATSCKKIDGVPAF